MMYKSLIMCLFFLSMQVVHAQNLVLREFLDEINADSIVEVTEIETFDAMLVRHSRKGKWGLYEIEKERDFLTSESLTDTTLYDLKKKIIPMKFDSLSFAADDRISNEMVVVKNKGKYGLLKNPEIYGADSWKGVKCQYEKIVTKHSDIGLHVLFKDHGKWGLINWPDGRVIFDPMFDRISQVPLYKVDTRTLNLMQMAKKSLKADLVLIDFNNSDGAFKARIEKTGKWGMYQSYNAKDIKELIPPVYDSIDFFQFNADFTTVYNNGKVGMHTSKWSYGEEAKETVRCIYDDYKLFKADGRIKLAVKRDGFWGWINYITGDEKSEFKYKTPDDLPYPYFKQ